MINCVLHHEVALLASANGWRQRIRLGSLSSRALTHKRAFAPLAIPTVVRILCSEIRRAFRCVLRVNRFFHQAIIDSFSLATPLRPLVIIEVLAREGAIRRSGSRDIVTGLLRQGRRSMVIAYSLTVGR